MLSYISPKPTFHFSYFFSKNGKSNARVFPLNQQQCYYFFSARYALTAGIKALGLVPGTAVLLPSYNCGTEIDPFLHLGLKPIYYKIDGNMLIDFDDLLGKITDDVSAILVTHYLGFPQPVDEIKKICISRKLFLIEDCAHAFLSKYKREFLGVFGDISIFSLRKSLPIPDGGVLVINNKQIMHQQQPEKPSLFSVYFVAAEMSKKTSAEKTFLSKVLNNTIYASLFSLRFFLRVWKRLLNADGLYLVYPDSYDFMSKVLNWKISKLSKRIISNTCFELIKKSRYRNFEHMLEYFLRNRSDLLVFKELPQGVCPLFFPILIGDAQKRDMLYECLKKRGIITHPWWNRFHQEVPWDEFPDAVYLKQRLLGLPIHQDLNPKDLDLVIREFEKAYKNIEK